MAAADNPAKSAKNDFSCSYQVAVPPSDTRSAERAGSKLRGFTGRGRRFIPDGSAQGTARGGRDRDAMLAYKGRRSGRTPRKRAAAFRPGRRGRRQRAMLLAALRSAPHDTTWLVRYAIRRLAWHILDHAWEMEDRTT